MTNIRTLRKAAGLSQEQLANRAGVTRHTVRRWEKKERTGRQHQFMVQVSMFADALGCEVKDVLKEEL